VITSLGVDIVTFKKAKLFGLLTLLICGWGGGAERYFWFHDVQALVSLPASAFEREFNMSLPASCQDYAQSMRVEVKMSETGEAELRCSTIDSHTAWWPFVKTREVPASKFHDFYSKLTS
jgi:hypothetical protein